MQFYESKIPSGKDKVPLQIPFNDKIVKRQCYSDIIVTERIFLFLDWFSECNLIKKGDFMECYNFFTNTVGNKLIIKPWM